MTLSKWQPIRWTKADKVSLIDKTEYRTRRPDEKSQMTVDRLALSRRSTTNSQSFISLN